MRADRIHALRKAFLEGDEEKRLGLGPDTIGLLPEEGLSFIRPDSSLRVKVSRFTIRKKRRKRICGSHVWTWLVTICENGEGRRRIGGAEFPIV